MKCRLLSLLWGFMLVMGNLQLFSQNLIFNVGADTGAVGDTVFVPITVDNFTGISGYQGTVAWDSAVLDFIEITSPTPGISNIFGQPGQGLIPLDRATFSWIDFSGGSVTLTNGTPVIQLSFEIKATAPLGPTPVDVDSSVTNLAYLVSSVLMAPTVNEGSVLVNTTAMTFNLSMDDGFPGDTVTIPISVDNFNAIAGYQGTIRWDSALLDFIDLTSPTAGINNIFGLPGQGLIPLDAATFSWINFSGGTTTLPDSSVVIELRFKIKTSAFPGITPVEMNGSVTALGYSDGTVILTPGIIQGSVMINSCTISADASFTMVSSICQDAPNPQALIFGDLGGVFSVDGGASIDPVSGILDLSSTMGDSSYTVTYIVGSSCPDTATASIMILRVDDPSFSIADTVCISGFNPQAVITGDTGGSFSVDNGASIDPTSGILDLTTTSPGTSYTVSYTTTGVCFLSSSQSVFVADVQDASFSYPSSVCPSGPNPVATITGLSGGTFSTASGFPINPTTGELDMSAATLGTTYTIFYDLFDACQSFSSQTVTIEDILPPDTVSLPDVMAECSATVAIPSTMDNCAGTISGTSTDALTYSSQGTFTINWTFDDGNGNQTMATQRVIVQDSTPPLAQCQSLTVQLDSTGIAVITPEQIDNGSSDACGIASLSLSQDTFGLADVGIQTVVLMVMDSSGNSSSCEAMLTIEQTTSIADALALGLSLKAYPNPTEDVLHIAFDSPWYESLQVSLVNQLGQTIQHRIQDKHTDVFETSLQLKDLPSGVYIVQVEQGNQVLHARVFKR